MDIFLLKLNRSFEPPAEHPLRIPHVRYFAPVRSYQPIPLLRSEKHYFPDFKSEEEAGYAIWVFHERLKLPRPCVELPDLEDQKRTAIQASVEKFIRDRRLEPMVDTEEICRQDGQE